MSGFAKSLKSTYWIFGAIGLGIGAGLLFGKSTDSLGDLGKLYIQLIKAFAMPLLFFAILEAVISTEIRFRSAGRFLTVAAVNSSIAAAIGLILSNVIRPGDHLHLTAKTAADSSLLKQAEGKHIDLMAFVNNVLPTNLVEPFSTNNVLGLVFLSVLFGAAVRSFKREDAPWVPAVENLVEGGLRVSERMMIWLVKLTPLAVFGVIAKVVGDTGFSMFGSLVKYALTALLGLGIQILVVYQLWLHFYCKRSLREFWREASESVLYAFGVNSSLASLPLTLKALDRMGCGKESSRMAACIGTNLNNDGILLYEAMAAIFVAQTLGMNLSLSAQLTVALLCMITAIGIAGVPDAGIISLAVVLATLGIPMEILPILLVVDWIIARVRSVTNVSADMTTALILDRMEKGRPVASAPT